MSAASQCFGVGQRVRLHGLATQQLNDAEGVIRDPIVNGRVGVALTAAAAEVLAKWPNCLQVKPQNLALLQPRVRLGAAVALEKASGKFKSDCSQRACDSCLREASSGKPLRECAACKQAFYCDGSASYCYNMWLFFDCDALPWRMIACLSVHLCQDSVY